MAAERDESFLTILCHPYLFALQEGLQTKRDPMDYSLLLLQRTCTEVIKTPKTGRSLQETFSKNLLPSTTLNKIL